MAATGNYDTPPLCDWERSVVNCGNSGFVKITLIVCATLHFFAGILGMWVLWYRNGGFKASIVTNLFTTQKGNIRPRPIDCAALSMTIACFLRIPSNVMTVLDLMPMWFRVMFVGLYWWTGVIVLVVTYLVETLYALPVTECEGTFAVYRPQKLNPASSKSPIYLFYPTPNQRDAIFIISLANPLLFGLLPGVASAALEEQGHLKISRFLYSVQNTVWGAQNLVWSCIVMYYGLKFILILRAHIMATEARNNLALAAFGLTALKGGSPARYLYIMILISIGGVSLTLLAAGSTTILWAWYQDPLSRPENERWFNLIAVIWTCAVTLVFYIKFGLIAIHCSRAKRDSVPDFGIGASQESAIVGSQNRVNRLRLRWKTSSAWSEVRRVLERMLSVAAKGNDEAPTMAVDARFRVDEHLYEQHSNNSVSPLAIVNLSKIAMESRVASPSTAASSTSNRLSEQNAQVQEFLLLQRKHQCLVQRVHALQLDPQRQQRRSGTQCFCALQERLQDARQSLEQLEAHYSQLQSMQAQSEEMVRRSPAENIQDLYQSSTMSILQQKLKFTLQQLNHEIEAYHSDLAL